ncbi:aminotransferase class I/II-fold pyridoxal phosphate-dependent enzyme [Flavilitoribacter nigricans]|uniref:8-amino-7-oxononanoate synthase n=1 Tax=Flavilitoribacter nigricans (strain ATCC 23147 / DSM 23189 / NBRC 102662 / NCIMB 1420 / SS-2) TaxID=1122177 RepID=A0A2D0N095_FLAN2|nr:8-amino-7-oxononanoate synthase [Flavilitoribacter nigricans]PHN01796.1 8-amino-7-oxononanoate synthase [Flavilitoribacter nigricans DSM 23189 = NBRC 102662]
MDPIDEYLKEQLAQRREANSLRKLPPAEGGLDFCSNDYLGLAEVHFPTSELPRHGATGSRLISGNHAEYERLELELAQFLQSEAALVFGSGYQANLGLISCIAGRQDTILYDQLVHASIRDALRLTNARSFSFRHNDVAHLRQRLDRSSGRVFVIVESVYSMDGDEAPLADIVNCCRSAGAALIVDEAHALGVLGPAGRGLSALLGLEDLVWARIFTFGKALGVHGAAVLGSKLLREFLVNFSRPFIYTTGLPQDTVLRIRQSIAYLQETDRMERLHQLIGRFKDGLHPGVREQLIPSRSAIQSLIVPGNEAVKAVAGKLQDAGYRILPILHPTVPAGSERLRICLHSFNREADIDRLAGTLNAIMEPAS